MTNEGKTKDKINKIKSNTITKFIGKTLGLYICPVKSLYDFCIQFEHKDDAIIGGVIVGGIISAMLSYITIDIPNNSVERNFNKHFSSTKFNVVKNNIPSKYRIITIPLKFISPAGYGVAKKLSKDILRVRETCEQVSIYGVDLENTIGFNNHVYFYKHNLKNKNVIVHVQHTDGNLYDEKINFILGGTNNHYTVKINELENKVRFYLNQDEYNLAKKTDRLISIFEEKQEKMQYYQNNLTRIIQDEVKNINSEIDEKRQRNIEEKLRKKEKQQKALQKLKNKYNLK